MVRPFTTAKSTDTNIWSRPHTYRPKRKSLSNSLVFTVGPWITWKNPQIMLRTPLKFWLTSFLLVRLSIRMKAKMVSFTILKSTQPSLRNTISRLKRSSSTTATRCWRQWPTSLALIQFPFGNYSERQFGLLPFRWNEPFRQLLNVALHQ